METSRFGHWAEPCLIVGSWLVGLALCVGHFMFYRSLNGSNTDGHGDGHTIAGYQFTAQQLNIAIGTTFAFTVKSAFVLAASTAYFQAFWNMTEKQSLRAKAPKIASLDALYSALNNITSLFRLPLGMRHPLLLLMALDIWLLSVPSLITPGTLSVTLKAADPEVTLKEVPAIDFSTLSFVAPMTTEGMYPSEEVLGWTYNGPNELLTRLAMAVAPAGEVLPIKPPLVNSTWQLQFPGPALRCANAPASERALLRQSVFKAHADSGLYDQLPPPLYLSWISTGGSVEWGAANTSSSSPYTPNGHHQKFNDGTSVFSTTISGPHGSTISFMDDSRVMTITLNFATFPSGYKLGVEGKIRGLLPSEFFDDMAFVRCQFTNSTYVADFKYVDGLQTITTHLKQPETPAKINLGVASVGALASPGCPIFCSPFDWVNNPSQPINCTWNEQTLETLAYQAVFQQFTKLVIGNITSSIALMELSSQILNTALSRAEEMQSMSAFQTSNAFYQNGKINEADYRDQSNANSLQAALWHSNFTIAKMASGMQALKSAQSGATLPLNESVEHFFSNFVVSLMSHSAFQKGGISGTEPQRALVTSTFFKNTYVFAMVPFTAAYGVAAALSLIAVVVGMCTIFAARASYTHDFSTVLRVARQAELSVEVKEQDLSGRSPLPAYLANATLRLRPALQVEVVPASHHAHSSEEKQAMTSSSSSTESATVRTALLKNYDSKVLPPLPCSD